MGHKNPDTDSIVSAIALAELEGVTPARAGEINKETEYVLKRFDFDLPQIAPAEEKKIMLVDMNGNPEEMAEGVKPEEIISIIDHHKLSGFKTSEPINVHVRAVGATATLIKSLYQKNQKEISKEMAGLLLSAVISDTLKLTSPTTTKEDTKCAEELTKLAGLNIDELADAMFAAKSDISGVPTEELLGKDYKVFEMSGKKVGAGVWETVLPATILERKPEIIEKLAAKKSQEGLDLIFFAGVDILKGNSDLFIVSGAEKAVAEAVWGGETKDGVLALSGVVSRKKQIVPPLENYLASH